MPLGSSNALADHLAAANQLMGGGFGRRTLGVDSTGLGVADLAAQQLAASPAATAPARGITGSVADITAQGLTGQGRAATAVPVTLGPTRGSQLAAQAASQMGGQLGMAQRVGQSAWLRGTPVGQMLTGNVRAGLRGAAPYAIGGQLLGMGIDSLFGDPNSSLDNIAASAARWGGAGAALGPWGAAGGALIGGIKGYWDSRDEGDKAVASEVEKQSRKLNNLLSQYGASDNLQQEALLQLQLGAMEATNRDQVKDLMSSLTAQLTGAVAADRQQQQSDRMAAANLAAVQSWMGPLMQDALARQQWYADQSAESLHAAARTYADPSMRASTRVLADRVSANAATAAAAQLGQLAATPGIFGYYSGTDPQTGAANGDLASLATAQPTNGASALEMMLATGR